MSLRLSIALPNHGILGGGTARGVQARGSNSAIVVVVVVVVVAPRVAFTDCLASVPSSRNRFPPSECYTPWYCYPPRRQRQRGSGGRSWLGVWDRNRPSPTRRADGLVSLVSLVLLVLCRAVTSVY